MGAGGGASRHACEDKTDARRPSTTSAESQATEFTLDSKRDDGFAGPLAPWLACVELFLQSLHLLESLIRSYQEVVVRVFS